MLKDWIFKLCGKIKWDNQTCETLQSTSASENLVGNEDEDYLKYKNPDALIYIQYIYVYM